MEPTFPIISCGGTVIWSGFAGSPYTDIEVYLWVIFCVLCARLCVESFKNKIQKAIGPHEDLMTIVKRRRPS